MTIHFLDGLLVYWQWFFTPTLAVKEKNDGIENLRTPHR